MSSASTKPALSDRIAPTTTSRAIFNHKPLEFKTHFNRLPLEVSHNLARHPLFDLARLVELAKTLWGLGGGKVLFQEGEITFDRRWDEIPRKAISFIEGLRTIQDSRSWVLLKTIQEDPEYGALIDRCVAELSALTGADLEKEITWLEGYIFIASPRAVTPHHIDHESNFLLQIQGEKSMNVCDPNDRSVLFEEEIENYYLGDLSAAVYKPASQAKACVFPLTPGRGVHIPSKGPHWVRNGDQPSVSFSINFCMRDLDVRARVYQFNHYLRRLNLTPTPPGKSRFRDRLKVMSLARLGRKPAANKYELLRQDVRRLDGALRIVERLFRRSAAPRTTEQ